MTVTIEGTLYDSAGRAWRTISGRVPLTSVPSESSVAQQSTALANYPTHGDAPDPYAADNLSSGVISDTLFDDRGRQHASLGHPLPAADVGLSGTNYDGKLVRPRSETVFDSLGHGSVQRSGLAHVESTSGVFQGVYDAQSVDTKTYTDAFGNAYRSEFITGGTIAYDSQTKSTTRTGGSVHSYTLTRYDDENRPIAEMQQTTGTVTAAWSGTENSFVIDGTSTAIPTKLYVYDTDDRLAAVELPAVANPLDSGAIERPRYEYGYDARGNQTLIVDPLGNETRFSFTAQGQQATRTLPLGFGTDGEAGTGDDPVFTLPPGGSSFSEGRAGQTGSFTEGFTYDERGRQVLYVSFEGVVTENVYDGYGRLSHVNYYADQAALAAETISERWSYEYDSHGRKSAAIHSVNSGGTFTTDRIEETFYDDRGRVIAEVGPEGVIGYDYDSSGRMTHTAVYKSETDYGSGTADRLTHYDYDLLGRLVSVKEDATPANLSDDVNRTETDYTFDLAGRMDTQTSGTGSQPVKSVTTDYDYDALGRLDIQTDTDESGNTLARYDYTVRADGKRTSLTESFWLTDDDNDGTVDATDGDGIQQEDELDTTTYDWTYDSVGRLTDEAITHFDSGVSQAESFEYDLTGNRTRLEKDTDGDSSVDEVFTYDYDANDRLTFEWLDSNNDTVIDQTTEYGYDHTQQISKTVTANSQTVSKQIFGYNLQGRMSSVVNEGYTSGTLSSRERTSYEYDSNSYRVTLTTETGTATGTIAGETWTLQSSTEFLADAHNHTGYTQTIRETATNADGTTKTVDYTFGHDAIAQRVVERDALGALTSDTTHIFGHDGHGSVRVLYDLAGTADRITQAFTFAAYGQLLAVHGTAGVAVPLTAALTSLGYSGEHFDAKAQQQYLRARWYDPANGRFNRLDPFAGNMQDPQSLHKYAYVHGDPIQGIDPTGLSDQPYFLQVGNAAHAVIQAEYVAWGVLTGKVVVPEFVHSHFQGRLRPDLVNLTDAMIGEIKPLSPSSVADGYAKLQAALLVANGLSATHLGQQISAIGVLPNAAGDTSTWLPEIWNPGIQAFPLVDVNSYLNLDVIVTLGNWDGLIVYKRVRIRGNETLELALARATEVAADLIDNIELDLDGKLTGNELVLFEHQWTINVTLPTIQAETYMLTALAITALGAGIGTAMAMATMNSTLAGGAI